MKPKAVHALLFICNLLSASDGTSGKPIDPASYACSSSSAEPSDIDPNHGLRPEFASTFDIGGIQEMAAEAYREEQHAASLHKPNLKSLISRHSIELPSAAIAAKRVAAGIRQHPTLSRAITGLKRESTSLRKQFPTRLLFIGPSGCGKTDLAISISKHCNMHCLFVEGTSIADTYQNSGATYLGNIFDQLMKYPKEDFLVIIDEIASIMDFSQNASSQDQVKTVRSFWSKLDRIKKKQHICVIGTDNKSPDELPTQIKTRFAGKIFHFSQADTTTIVEMMKERLESIPGQDNQSRACSSDSPPLHNCTDSFLNSMAKRASHLSLREIESCIEDAIDIAIDDPENPADTVLEKHVRQAWEEHDLTRWNDLRQNMFLKYVTRRNTASLASNLGFCLTLYGTLKDAPKVEKIGILLTGIANAYLLKTLKKDDENTARVLSSITQTVDSLQRASQFERSHALQIEASDREKEKTKKDDDRYDQQRKDRSDDLKTASDRFETSTALQETSTKMQERADRRAEQDSGSITIGVPMIASITMKNSKAGDD